jgi:hypothetical protein
MFLYMPINQAKLLIIYSGAHTIGLSQCTNFRARIYNETNISAAFATLRRAGCPAAAGNGDVRQPGAAGRRDAHRVRQRLLLYTGLVARSGLAPALGPAALQRRRHGRAGAHLRVHADSVQQGLRRRRDQDGERQPAHRLAGADQARLLQGELAHMHRSERSSAIRPVVRSATGSCHLWCLCVGFMHRIIINIKRV